MTMMNTFAFALGLLCATQPATVHPALAPDRPSLQAAWDRGYREARTRSDMDAIAGRFRRGLGSVNGEVVSFLAFQHPRLVAYEDGFRARRRNLPETALAEERRAAVERAL